MAALGAETAPLVFGPPALPEDVALLEESLGLPLPPGFRHTLISLSSSCIFSWQLPDDFSLPPTLKGIFRGELYWNLATLAGLQEGKDQWVAALFADASDTYNAVWHNKLALQEVGNGDYIALDLAPGAYGQVVYLSHDDGEGHGYVMAQSFPEFLETWGALGCPGGEDWQWLPFCDSPTSGINPEGETARLWKATIGLA